MILSMTGFGKSEKKNKDFTFSVEVKSLNNRFIEVTTKTPYYMSQYDKDIVSLVKKECLRGKIIVNVNIASNNANSLILNKTKLNAVMELSKEISKQTNLENNLLLSDVINFPNVYEEKKLIETNSNKRLLLGTVKDALKDLYTFRSIEGNNLKQRLLNSQHFTISELGFGSGLNFLLTWKLFNKANAGKGYLDYISIEGFPLNKNLIRKVHSKFPELSKYSNQLLNSLPPL